MKHFVSISLLFVSLTASGCSSLYVAKEATPDADLTSSISGAEEAKVARVEAEIAAAAKAEVEGEAAWKKAQDDYLAGLSETRATWFKRILLSPRVTIGMTEAEIKLLIHWKVKAAIVVSKANRTDARSQGEITIWTGVPLAGPGAGAHKGPLTVSFRNGKVISVENGVQG